jgi:vacuolar-type H+-ATPase subunit H
MSIEEIRGLVKQERELEGKHIEAERKAADIINAAKEKAAKMLEEVSDESYYKDILTQKTKEIDDKEYSARKETDQKINLLEQTATKNRSKTISFIIELVLEK